MNMNNNSNSSGTTMGANVVHESLGSRLNPSSRGDSNVGKRDMYISNVDTLASYLERPILIDALEWGMGVTLYESYPLLKNIIDAGPIKDKLKHFMNISFNIEVSLEVAANPFLYGMLLINWVPYPKHDGLLRDRGIFFEDNVEASQRQHIFIDASTSTGGKMVIPFYWPANYFNLVKDDPANFGYLSVRQLNPLMHVTGADQKVTVYIRAKMTNIHMHTSTSADVGAYKAMSLQSDESPNDKLSTAATRVADVASSLTPFLGGYAIATEKAARTSAAVLRALGLSHPKSKEMVHKMENRPLGNVSNFNVPCNALTLGLDEHNEVTVDPTICGMDVDEMSFDYILKKETFLGTYDWDINDSEGKVLATHRIHPMQWAKTTIGGEVHMTPLAYLSRLFQYWTGSLVFRFQIVVSAWHRGRLRLIHEPAYATSTPDTTWQTNIQSVIDITENREFEITVSFAQAQEWLQTQDYDSNTPPYILGGTNDAFSQSQLKESNGVLFLSVMNRLVIPDDTITAPAHINVFVRAGDDFQLACPIESPLQSLGLSPVVPPPSGKIQSLSSREMSILVSPIGNATLSSTGPTVPVFNRDVTPTLYAYLGPTSHPATITVQKMSGTGTTITLHSSAGSSETATYNGSGLATVTVPLPSGSGYAHVPLTVTMDSNALVKAISADIPVQDNHEWVSAWRTSPTPKLYADSVNDLNPSSPYPLTMNTSGAPAIYYRDVSSNHFYETSNNGQPVFVTYAGDIRIVNGVYNPTLVNFDDGGTLVTGYYTPPTSGYAANNVNIGWQGLGSATGVIYNVVFCHTVTPMAVQADEHTDEIGVETRPGTIATLHDTAIQRIIPSIYMGERITHVRQIIGRPYHSSTIVISRETLDYTRAIRRRTNLPAKSDFQISPFTLMMSCYNGWHGSTRMRYILNYPESEPPTYVQIARNKVGVSGTADTNHDYDLSVVTVPNEMYETAPSLWSGACISNPRLANEISAEFPYYYRFRFRSCRPLNLNTSASSTDTHNLIVDSFQSTMPISVEQYFQPGDDISFFNWMGTPVLYDRV